jgi:hypothetical protein
MPHEHGKLKAAANKILWVSALALIYACLSTIPFLFFPAHEFGVSQHTIINNFVFFLLFCISHFSFYVFCIFLAGYSTHLRIAEAHRQYIVPILLVCALHICIACYGRHRFLAGDIGIGLSLMSWGKLSLPLVLGSISAILLMLMRFLRSPFGLKTKYVHIIIACGVWVTAMQYAIGFLWGFFAIGPIEFAAKFLLLLGIIVLSSLAMLGWRKIFSLIDG